QRHNRIAVVLSSETDICVFWLTRISAAGLVRVADLATAPNAGVMPVVLARGVVHASSHGIPGTPSVTAARGPPVECTVRAFESIHGGDIMALDDVMADTATDAAAVDAFESIHGGGIRGGIGHDVVKRHDVAAVDAFESPYCALHRGPASGCDAWSPGNPVARCVNDTSCQYNWHDTGIWGCCKISNAHQSGCRYPREPEDADICF